MTSYQFLSTLGVILCDPSPLSNMLATPLIFTLTKDVFGKLLVWNGQKAWFEDWRLGYLAPVTL